MRLNLTHILGLIILPLLRVISGRDLQQADYTVTLLYHGDGLTNSVQGLALDIIMQ